MKSTRQFLAGIILLCAPTVFAQVAATPPAPEPPPAAPAPPPSKWSQDGIDIYLYGDVYGTANTNRPRSGYNQLYNFDDKANNVHLSLAKVSLEKASGIFGFRADIGVGRTLDIISAADDGPGHFKYAEQLFLEFRPEKAHGLQLDFGKFVTSAGAEVIEAGTNWNYSRSLLFVLAIPYYHFGARATLPVNKAFTAGVQVVNGWNSLGTNNKFQTVGIVGNFTFKKGTWANVFYTGPQDEGGVSAYRQVYDSVLTINPTSKGSFYINFDYGSDKQPHASRQKWTGVALAGKYQFNDRFAFSPRVEYYDDIDGFSTGVAQILTEVTLTGEMKIRDGLLARVEYRNDHADHPYFDRRSQTTLGKNQNVFALGIIASFGPKK